MRKKTPLALLFALVLAACGQKESTVSVSAPGFEAHVRQLASDEFQGRLPFTGGEKTTVAYLQEQYKSIGLEPGNGDSYLQEVPMVEITSTAEAEMSVKGTTTFSLKGREDYVIWTERTEDHQELDQADLVFAGFGVVAPEYNWNDYEGLDVKGKVVLVLVNDPGFGGGDSTFFKGNTMTYYGRWTYKYEEAARQGARACLVIHNTVPAGYAFNVPQNNWNSPHLYLDERGKEQVTCALVGWISMPATEKLFDEAGKDFSEQQSAARRPGFKGGLLSLRVSTKVAVKAKYDKSVNVVGKITGNARPDEYILYTAHWDHLGIGRKNDLGDSIYNGAHDNASGTAGMLEIARAFTQGEKPGRSVIFLAVTAEEQGLKGSDFYARNPIFPVEQTVANINIDGVNTYGRMKDIVLIGGGQSELEDYLRAEAAGAGRYIASEPHPEAGYYFRSDHFNFAKVGIPSLFTASGIDHVEKGKEYGQQLQDDFRTKHYHQPSDEFNPANFNSEGAVDDLNLLYRVGSKLADGSNWPKWKKSSEFAALRKQQDDE